MIGFIGLGKLGYACAEIIAEKYSVTGYDITPKVSNSIHIVDTICKVVNSSDIIFVAAPTPHDPMYDGSEPTSHLPNKDFDYSIVKDILIEVNKYATKDKLIVLISTVLPGTVRRELISLLPNTRFIYNPYLIAMGTVKWDMVNPEMVMIGTEDGSETGDAKQLIDFYKTLMQNDPRYFIGTWDECECLKVFYNTFISAKVSLVNMIQDVAEKQGNINAELVCDALANSGRRIMGPGYMKPGMGDGGACHPRDNIALRYMAEKLDLGYDLFDAVMRSREVQAENMAKRLVDLSLHEDSTPMPIVIVGKAYKPLVPYTAGSSSMLVGHYVKKYAGELYYYDEYTGDNPPTSILAQPCVFLLAHCPEITYGNQLVFVKDWYKSHQVTESDEALVRTANGTMLIFAQGSIIVDPWRKTPKTLDSVTVIHYGDTR